MNQPWIYMCSPFRSPLPPPSPSNPSGSSQCTSPEHLSHASNLGWWSVSPLRVYLFQCCSFRISHPRLLPQGLKVCSIHCCQSGSLPWELQACSFPGLNFAHTHMQTCAHLKLWDSWWSLQSIFLPWDSACGQVASWLPALLSFPRNFWWPISQKFACSHSTYVQCNSVYTFWRTTYMLKCVISRLIKTI